MATWDTVRELGLSLPEAEESTSYGTPALKLRGKMFARLRDEGDTLVLKIDPEERELMVESQPHTYFFTAHYENYPGYVLVRLAAISDEELQDRVTDAWLLVAPKRLAAQLQSQ